MSSGVVSLTPGYANAAMSAHPSDALDADEFGGLADEAAEWGIRIQGTPVVARRMVETEDGAVSALVWGDGEAEVVFLHGLGLNAHTWDAVCLSLARPAVAIDLPGHGHSAWRPDGCYDPRVIAPAVATAMELLAEGAGCVVGQSLGGLTGIALADLRQDLVARLVLVDALPHGPVPAFLDFPTSFGSRDEVVEWAMGFGLGSSRAATRRAVVLNTMVAPDGRVVWRHHPGRDPAGVTIGDQSGLWESLAAVAGPVTLVRATRGFVTEAQLAELAERAPAVRVVGVDAGHNVQEQDPVGLAGIIAGALGAT